MTNLKLTRKMLLISALAVMLAGGTAAVPASAKSAPDVKIQMTYSSGSGISGSIGGNAQIKNGISYMPATLVRAVGIEVRWNSTTKTADFSGWNKSFQVKLGSPTGILDGKKVQLGGTPYMANNELYVPVKFIVSALEGGTVRWDPVKRTLLANGLHMYRGYSETFEGQTYSLSLDSGELYVTTKQNKKYKLASLGRGLDVIDFTFERTPAGLTLLKVSNVYGEPHLHADYHTYLLKNGSVIRQGYTDTYTTFGEGAVWSDDGKLVMNDGYTLRLIEDGTGAVRETIDLPRLMGVPKTEDVYYNVEGVFKDVLLVRPVNTAFLTLVNRTTGEQTLLYKELLSAERQADVAQIDYMFPGDHIRFTGREGNVFTFKVNYLDGSKETVHTYTLPGSGE